MAGNHVLKIVSDIAIARTTYVKIKIDSRRLSCFCGQPKCSDHPRFVKASQHCFTCYHGGLRHTAKVQLSLHIGTTANGGTTQLLTATPTIVTLSQTSHSRTVDITDRLRPADNIQQCRRTTNTPSSFPHTTSGRTSQS